MYKIGDEIDGYCPRCRLNTYQIISATDGEKVLQATCRTCRNSFPWQPERTPDDLRKKQLDKLAKLTKAKLGGPEIATRGTKKKTDAEDFAAQLRALAGLTGKEPPTEAPPRTRRAAAAAAAELESDELPEPTARPAAEKPIQSKTVQWQQLTAKLTWRDGKPYQATRTYKEGDVMLHKAHGLGVVQQILNDRACLVLFRDSEQVLEMGATPER